MLITCPKCGKYLSEEASACPFCKHVLHAPEAKPAQKENPKVITAEGYDIDTERVLLYSLMQPAIKDFAQCRNVVNKIKEHLKMFREALSPRAYDMLCSHLTAVSDEAVRQQQAMADYNAKKMLTAFQSYQNAMSSSTYNGLGFSVLTDTAGAIAYSALDTFEGIKHDLMKEKAATKQFLSDIKELSTSDSSRYLKPILEALDDIACIIPELFAAKAFVEAHRDFYRNSYEYDLGITVGATAEFKGYSVYQALRGCTLCGDFVDYMTYTREQPRVAFDTLCNSGYIRILGDYYFTTCRYEKKTLLSLEAVKDPEAYAARKKRDAEHNQACIAIARQAEKEGHLWRAAVAYGRTQNDPASMMKSVALWHTFRRKSGLKSQSHAIGTCHYTDVQGNPRSIHTDNVYAAYTDLSRKKEINRIEHVRAWNTLPGGSNLYIGLDGRVIYTSNGQKVSKTVLNQIPAFSDVSDPIYAVDRSANTNILIGVRGDGRLAAIGMENFEGWDQLKSRNDIKLVHAEGSSVIALTKDGTLLAAGLLFQALKPQSQLHPDTVTLFHNAHSYDCSYAIYGINADGSVWVEGNGKEIANLKPEALPKNVLGHFATAFYMPNGTVRSVGGSSYDYRCFLESLKDVAKIDRVITNRVGKGSLLYEAYALRTDGTVIGPRNQPQIALWTDIVDIFSASNYNGTIFYAVNARGELLSSRDGVLALDEPIFQSADTVLAERRKMLTDLLRERKEELANVKGLFAGKKREELAAGIALLEKRLSEFDA